MKLVTKLTITALAVLSLSACQTRQVDQTQTGKYQTERQMPVLHVALITLIAKTLKYRRISILKACRTARLTQRLSLMPVHLRNQPSYVFCGTDVGGEASRREALREYDDKQLLFMLENQFAGINRFRIITRDDDVISQKQPWSSREPGP